MNLCVETKSIQELIQQLNDLLMNHFFAPAPKVKAALSQEEQLFEVLLRVNLLHTIQVCISLNPLTNPDEVACVKKVLLNAQAFNVQLVDSKENQKTSPSWPNWAPQLIEQHKKIVTILSDKKAVAELECEQNILKALSGLEIRSIELKFHIKKMLFLIEARIGTMDSIKKAFLECKALYETSNAESCLDYLDVLSRMQNLYYHNKEYPSALNLCEEIDAFLKKTNPPESLKGRQTLILRNLIQKTELQNKLHRQEEALMTGQAILTNIKALNPQGANSLNKWDVGCLHQILGSSYLALNDADLSIEHYKKALPIFEKYSANHRLFPLLAKMAMAFEKKGLYLAVSQCYKECAGTLNKIPGDNRVALAGTYLRMGKATIASKYFQSALDQLKKANSLYSSVLNEPGVVVDPLLRLRISAEHGEAQALIRTTQQRIDMPPPSPGVTALIQAAARLRAHSNQQAACANPNRFYQQNNSTQTPKRMKMTTEDKGSSCNP
jgi:tetratricopeptide (TPR) repeat protein